MKAVGDYVLIEIEEITGVGGISIKNDGVGKCLSAPSLPEIEGKRILFDSHQKPREYDGLIILDKKYIMGVFE
jgi:hypothetical protein